MEGHRPTRDVVGMTPSLPRHHSIRVVCSRETTGEGWLRLHAWMREWAGRTELHLVHIEQLDLVGLQGLLGRIEFAIGQGADEIVIDLGMSSITPAAMVALIAEREQLERAGRRLTLRGRANLRGAPSPEGTRPPRHVPSGRPSRDPVPHSLAPRADHSPRQLTVRNRRVRIAPS